MWRWLLKGTGTKRGGPAPSTSNTPSGGRLGELCALRKSDVDFGADWYGLESSRATSTAVGLGDLLWPKPQVRPIRFHDLRHTCASLLQQAGCSLPAVSRALGHADVRITLERYGHLAPEYLRAEVDRLSFGPAVARFATPVLREVAGEKKWAGDASQNRESSPACGMERETGFEPATLSLGS